MCSIGALAASPAWFDLYYKTEEEFLFASADAMHDEYNAIVDAGIILQIDDPSLPDNGDMINPEPSLKEFKKFEVVRIEALNHALRGLLADRNRLHPRRGSWHGPHTTDIPLNDIVHSGAQRQCRSLFGRSGYRSRRARMAPAGRTTSCRTEEATDSRRRQSCHQYRRASASRRARIVRYAKIVGRENVIAGTDRGPWWPHPSVYRLGQARSIV